jgi:hypothetical protein
MSQLQVNRINDASGGVLAPISSVMRNRIINGAMTISQRNGTSSVAVGVGSTYVLDRWVNFRDSSGGAYSVQQDAGAVTPPAGFNDYLGITVTATDTFGSAGTQFNLAQFIEGFNTADLDFGKSTAKAITLSFWVQSSLTGTFAGGISNSAGDRSYVFTYTINSANTWEQKSVTIAGDTTGTWLTNNGIGIRTIFSLGTGATNQGTAGVWAGSYVYNTSAAVKLLSTSGATFYITGVQLEVGTQATSFEYRQYQQELALCQRYYETMGIGTGGTCRSNTFCSATRFAVPKRASPTVAVLNSTLSFSNGSGTAITLTGSTLGGAAGISANGVCQDIFGTFSTSPSTGLSIVLLTDNAASVSAEL